MFRIRKYFLLAVTTLLITSYAAGQSPEQTAIQAAKAYNNKQFKAASELYEKIIASGYESYAVYYNLGNACYRNNEPTKAILYYEKALKIEPNNEDILHNVEVINSKAADKMDRVPELFYKRWWKNIVNSTDLNTLSILTILLISFSLLSFSFYIASANIVLRKTGFWLGITFLVLFAVGMVAASQRNHYLVNSHEAIVFEPTVNIKSSPDENSKDIFVLHEGTKVTLLDEVAEWQEIRISNGSIGWIKSTDLRKI